MAQTIERKKAAAPTPRWLSCFQIIVGFTLLIAAAIGHTQPFGIEVEDFLLFGLGIGGAIWATIGAGQLRYYRLEFIHHLLDKHNFELVIRSGGRVQRWVVPDGVKVLADGHYDTEIIGIVLPRDVNKINPKTGIEN